MRDLVWTGVLSLVVGASLVAAEVLRRALGWRTDATRRLVHAGIGLAVVGAAGVLEGPGALYALSVACAVLNGSRKFKAAVPSLHAVERPSQGTMVFPLALLVLLASCWSADVHRLFALRIAFLVLAVSDPLAAAVGQRFGAGTRFRVGTDEKSLVGSAAFFLSAFGLTLGGLVALAPFPTLTTASLATLALVVAAAATAAELLGQKGWDNLTIAIAVAAPLVFVHADPARLAALTSALAWAAGFGVLAFLLRFLDLSGAVAASLLGLSVLGLGGWEWAAPGLVFFVLSSVLSKVGRKRKLQAVQAEKGSRRDAGQVYANGGLSWLLLLAHVFWPQPWLYWAFVGAFAAAASDTWATEIGTYFRAPTRSIITLRTVPPGMSGGVSWPGTLGALAGAATVFAPIPFTRPESFAGLGLGTAFAIVVLSGLVASLADSALGGSVQALYADARGGGFTERRADGQLPNRLVRGVAWIDNDAVNLACTLAGAALVAALTMML